MAMFRHGLKWCLGRVERAVVQAADMKSLHLPWPQKESTGMLQERVWPRSRLQQDKEGVQNELAVASQTQS
eukprot:10145527-Prorocentrum_lima.AAC.1